VLTDTAGYELAILAAEIEDGDCFMAHISPRRILTTDYTDFH